MFPKSIVLKAAREGKYALIIAGAPVLFSNKNRRAAKQ
jgi:hypothetical protein